MTWERIDLSDRRFEQPSEPPDLFDLIYRGKRHLLSGPPEVAKTLLVLIAGLEHQRRGGTFVLLDFESGPVAVRQLLGDLGATAAEIKAIHYFEPGTPPEPDDIATIVALPDPLVVIDAAVGAFEASGLDDNKRIDAERFGRLWIDSFYRHGITTVVIDHVTKNAETRGRFAIGSERKVGRVDVHLGIETAVPLSRGVRGIFRVAAHKDRPGWLPKAAKCVVELELVSDPETHALSWSFRPPNGRAKAAGDDFRPTVLMERISRFLEEQPEPVPRGALEKLKGKTDYLRQARDCLLEEGYAQESDGLHGAKLLSSVKAFRSDDLAPTSPLDDSADLAPETPSKRGAS